MDDYRHVLCATSFSADSRPACAKAAALSDRFGGRLTLMHVVENFPENRSNDIIAPENADPRQFREDHARAKLADLASSSGQPDADLRVCFTTESAWQAILEFVHDSQVDLIVLVGHEHHTPTALTSSAEGIVSSQAPCDVLTVNP